MARAAGSTVPATGRALRVPKEPLKIGPLALPLLALLIRVPPPFEVLTQPIVVVGNRPEQLIAAEGEQGIEVIDVRRLGEGRRTAGSSGEILEPLQQRRDLVRLPARPRRGYPRP